MIGQGIDAGIRFGEKLEQDMICTPLGAPSAPSWSHPRIIFDAMCDRPIRAI